MTWGTERTDFESRCSEEFSLLYVIQTRSGGHTVSCEMGTGEFFRGAKWPGREANHSSATSARLKEHGNIDPISHTPSWRSF
jgi:hypothetical protein